MSISLSASFPGLLTTPDGDTCEITDKDLDISTVQQLVKDDGAGALAFFVGTTRNNFAGKAVIRLEYEAHTALALRTMSRIMQELRVQHQDLIRMSCHHRIGYVPVGQPSIIIAVSTPHRRLSFIACETILEQVKERAQIWKREWYAGEGECDAQWKQNFPSQQAGSAE